jgi:creatinine amidohydrolase
MPGLFIEHLTWPEVEAALAAYDTVLLPVGARCKEHGPHLPLNTDYLFAEYLARRVVEACRVLAAPTIPYGYYPAFVDYPGSTHVRAEAFRDTVVDVCQSFARHGVRKFYVLNTGVSTNRPLAEAQAVLTADGARMAFTDLHAVGAAARAAVERQPLGTHADEIETSNLLYVAPHVVRLALAKPELAPDRPGGLTRDPAAAAGVYSATGAWGDPTLAAAEKGRAVTEAMVGDIVGFLREEFGV